MSLVIILYRHFRTCLVHPNRLVIVMFGLDPSVVIIKPERKPVLSFVILVPERKQPLSFVILVPERKRPLFSVILVPERKQPLSFVILVPERKRGIDTGIQGKISFFVSPGYSGQARI